MEKFKETQLNTSEMRDKTGKKFELTGEKETILNPDENIALITNNEGGEGQGSGPEESRKKHSEEKDKDNDKGEEKKEGEENKESEKEEKEDQGENEENTDRESETNPAKELLEALIKQDERERNLEKLEEAKKDPEYQEKVADIKEAEELLKKLKETRENANEPEPFGDFSDREIVAAYQELEKRLAPFSDKMAQAWLEVVNNIAHKIEVFKEKYFRQGKPDIKKLQKYLPRIEMGEDMDNKLIYEQFVEKVKTELRPKMLRVELLVDNSGSMYRNINEIRMSIMLLNSSLRSFRVLFRDKMKDILGAESDESIDLVCDTEIRSFGERARMIKPFRFRDLSFLEPGKNEKEEIAFPEIDINQEKIDTLRAFQKITASEGDTLDSESWGEIYNSHDERLKRLLAENKLTEVVFQISDGSIGGTGVATSIIKKIKQFGISNAGLGIGAGAVESLIERHGEDNVISANTPEEIVEQFSKLLKRVVLEQVQKPMEQYLTNI